MACEEQVLLLEYIIYTDKQVVSEDISEAICNLSTAHISVYTNKPLVGMGWTAVSILLLNGNPSAGTQDILLMNLYFPLIPHIIVQSIAKDFMKEV